MERDRQGPHLTRIAWLLPALVTIGVHLPLLIYPTYIYDDLLLILHDPRVRELRWGEAWTGPYMPGAPDNLYRPLVTSSFLLQWWIHGDNPLGFRIVNVLAHAGVVSLVFVVARRLVGSAGAWLAALLFAVHPIHTEVLGSVAFRTESFAALAILGAMAVAMQEMTAGRIVAIGLLLTAGLLSKEQSLAIGPLVLLTGWACHEKALTPQQRRQVGILVGLMLWITAGYLIIRESLHPLMWDRSWVEWTFNAILITEGWDRVFFPIKLLGRYLLLMVWPVGLTIDYGGITIAPQTEWNQPYIWAGLIGIGVYVGLLIHWMRTRRWGLVVCLAGMAMTYFLVSNAVLIIVTHFNERLFYMPSAFVLMIIGWALGQYRKGLAIGLLACVPLAALTFAYTLHWGDRADLYAHNLAHTPGSIRLRLLLAREYQRRSQLDQAAIVLDEGVERIPQSWELWMLSAEIEALRGNEALALERLEVAWDIVPEHSRTYVGEARGRVLAFLREKQSTDERD